MREGPCIDIGANARLHGLARSLIKETGESHLIVMLVVAIISIQHSINFQYVAVGIRSCGRFRAVQQNLMKMVKTLELVSCSIKAKDNLHNQTASAFATQLYTGANIPSFFGELDHKRGWGDWACPSGFHDGFACHRNTSIRGWRAVYMEAQVQQLHPR